MSPDYATIKYIANTDFASGGMKDEILLGTRALAVSSDGAALARMRAPRCRPAGYGGHADRVLGGPVRIGTDKYGILRSDRGVNRHPDVGSISPLAFACRFL